jgi:hypothetical protein
LGRYGGDGDGLDPTAAMRNERRKKTSRLVDRLPQGKGRERRERARKSIKHKALDPN